MSSTFLRQKRDSLIFPMRELLFCFSMSAGLPKNTAAHLDQRHPDRVMLLARFAAAFDRRIQCLLEPIDG